MLNDSHSLFDDFEYSGFWWLPKTPDYKVAGTIRYRVGERISLELFGSLTAGSEDLVSTDDDVILGTADGNRDFTLQGC